MRAARMVVLTTVGAIVAACSGASAPVRPAWYPPPACQDCYQGIGEGPDYPSARRHALARLCEDIRVVVSSEGETERRQVLKQEMRGRSREETIEYTEYARQVDRSTSQCVFENQPIAELHREELDGRNYVHLVMPFAKYVRYLASRTVAVTFSSNARMEGDRLVAAAGEALRAQSYLVVEASSAGAAHVAVIAATVTLKPALQGLKVGSAAVTFKLTSKADGSIVKQKVLPELVARGFQDEGVLADLDEQAANALAAALAEE